ncbi:MAG: DUF805 domain-containing protein [Prevotella sp.]|jgi:uncharacterized membrane protein YhaH (DUF805 family)|nr:DUF805 domain-containing protein [Prevotella sp.]MCH3986136.1 DUF805 domain-containing protein [Prevotella sp.]MCH3992973.1 DUF805 domain-containing protein [Prevotella sp.]MCI1473857.1 DUF805 domain-containing protein [Prevotella sp.]MCI1518398.1 DUF805 domain-containing protein [Prevotella sp.]MCI1549320.1 DUF805 domain-containing protein [Prevotella sp.]
MKEDHSLQVQLLQQFRQSLKSVFHHYATFKGRAPRSEFWWFELFEVIVFFIASLVDDLVLDFVYRKFGFQYKGSIGILTLILFVGLLLPGLAVFWRRLHDTGRSGWYCLMVLIPLSLSTVLSSFSTTGSIMFGILGLIAMVVLLLFCCLDSQSEDNRYGPFPE